MPEVEHYDPSDLDTCGCACSAVVPPRILWCTHAQPFVPSATNKIADLCSRIDEEGKDSILDECRKQIKDHLLDIMPHLNLEPDPNFDALGPHQLCNRMPIVVDLRNINMAPLEAPHIVCMEDYTVLGMRLCIGLYLVVGTLLHMDQYQTA